MLQTSLKVSCWNIVVENSKGTSAFREEFMEWFENCFQQDLGNHIKHEPHHPYHLDFFSSKHLRGNDISADQFVQNLIKRDDQLFLKNIHDDKLTVMRLNKSAIPLFGYGNAIINIIVDSPAKKWFYKTRMIKLFGKDENNWISKENHPDFLRAKFKQISFQNQYKFQVSQLSFLKNFVVNEPAIRPFFNKSNLLQDQSNQSCLQLCINLSVIFDEQQFIVTMIDIFEQLDLGTPDIDLMRWAHKHYTHHNITPLKQ